MAKQWKWIWVAGCVHALACAPNGNPDALGPDASTPDEEVLPPLVGDLSCFTPGGSWNSQTLRADVGGEQTVELVTAPLGGDEGEVSAEVDISVWFDNTTSGDADVTGTTGNDGTISLTLPTCQPLTVKAVREPDTEVTYKANVIADPDLAAVEVTVVESLTAASIKAILNETINEESSLVAGTIYGCDGEPVVHARARVRDTSGALIEGARDYYFNSSGLPAKTQVRSDTNEDGKWVVFNLPIGEVVVEIYGNVCEGDTCEEVVLGSTSLVSAGNSVNIGNVFTGVESGVYYPAGCVEAVTP